MKKFLLFSATVAICGAIAFHHYHADFSWDAEASGDENGPIANVDQPLPHAVLASVDNDWVDLSSFKGKVVLITF